MDLVDARLDVVGGVVAGFDEVVAGLRHRVDTSLIRLQLCVEVLMFLRLALEEDERICLSEIAGERDRAFMLLIQVV